MYLLCYLINNLHNGIHHDSSQGDEDLPHVVEKDNILGGGHVGHVDIAGHQAYRDAGEDSGEDKGGDMVGEEADKDPAEDTWDSGEDEHLAWPDDLLEEAPEDSNDDLSIVLRCPCMESYRMPSNYYYFSLPFHPY
jgi:hypothetical protein